MPSCGNCDQFVTQRYVNVFAPDDADTVRVCPNCEDLVRQAMMYERHEANDSDIDLLLGVNTEEEVNTLRCRAYPEEETASEAWHHIDILRQIRNHAIRDYYSYEEGNRPNKFDQHKKLTEWKRNWSVFKEPSAHAAQQAISQIHKDIETLKERQKNGYNVGRLKWQGKGEFRSISYNESSRYDVDHNMGDKGFIQIRLVLRTSSGTGDSASGIIRISRSGEIWFMK